MEFVRGKTLQKIAEEAGKMEIDSAVKFIVQAARGLDYAHNKNIVHRDIKPDNIMINEEGVAKVADLGLAKDVTEADASVTMSGVGMGTPQYMAPEQAEGEPAGPDLAAQARDVDSFTSTRGRRGGALDDPWRTAERLVAEGRFEEAAHALYRGVLASIAQREQLRLDPSKTSGDYGRELRRRGSPLLSAFRAFARRFDWAVYGRGGCDAASLAALRELAEPFAPRARAA
jgi:serine/threonine protein kinase